MAETITAVYEKGVLRPLTPLDLAEHERVRLRILPDRPLDSADAVIQELITAGLVTPPVGRSDAIPLSDDDRRELAEMLGRGGGKTASEMIIEDRGAG